VYYNIGVKHARQRFIVEPNGDLVLHKQNVTWVVGADTDRYRNEGDGRFFFGLISVIFGNIARKRGFLPVYSPMAFF